MKVTTGLPKLGFDVPQTRAELFEGGGSPAGWSAISKYLNCPESARLSTLGIRKIRRASADGLPEELSAMQFGSLMHAVLAVRVVYGNEVACSWLNDSEVCRSLHPMDQEKAQTMLRVYDTEYPLESEPWECVGVEVTVVTDLGEGILRSVRYDALVRMKRDHALFSLERKTMARQSSGASAASSYTPQMLTQQTIWNRNEALVSKYGKIQGVWIDGLVKTQLPKCERLGPYLFTRLQEERMTEVLKLPNHLYNTMPVAADGSWPRYFNNCWGRFGPCEYIGLCHDNAFGDYEQVK